MAPQINLSQFVDQYVHQPQSAGDIQQMAALADSFLLALSNRQTCKADCYPGITAITHQVGSSKRWLTVEQYATNAI